MRRRADVVGDQAHDALAIGRRKAHLARRQSAGQPVGPQPAVGIEHDFNHGRVVEPGGDLRPHGRAQHARAADEDGILGGLGHVALLRSPAVRVGSAHQ